MKDSPYLSLDELLTIAAKNTLFSRQGFAFVIRHAPRTPLQTRRDVYEADLTPEGLQAAQEFGVALQKRFTLRGLFSSPIRRCIHTAEAIRDGYVTTLPIHSYWWLFSPFLAPRQVLNDRQTIHQPKIEIFSRNGFEEKAISSIDKRRLSIILERIKIPPHAGELTLYITHDSTVAPLYALLSGEEIVYVEDYPNYLEGLLLIKGDRQVQLLTFTHA